jgi:hypothetical protein
MDEVQKKRFYYKEKENEVVINAHGITKDALNNLLEIVYKFSIFEDNSKILSQEKLKNALPNEGTSKNSSVVNYTYSTSMPKIRIYKHINIYFLVHQEENLKEYEKYFQKFQIISKKSGMQIFIKFIFYDKFKGVVNSDDFYGDLKNYNSKLLFEELNDEEYLNILFLNDKSSKLAVKGYYNKDIDNDIFLVNLEEFNTIAKLISSRILPQIIKDLINDDEVLTEVMKIYNSKNFQFSRLLAESLNNLEKLNKIFYLYETIRTFENVKDKVSKI